MNEEKDRGAVLSVRFSAEELDELRERAARAGVPVSAFVRRFLTGRHQPQTRIQVGTPANATTNPKTTTGINITGYIGGYAMTNPRNA